MRFAAFSIASILVVFLVIGCIGEQSTDESTSTGVPPSPYAPSHEWNESQAEGVATKSLSEMILELDDFPEGKNWTLTWRGERVKSDLSEFALEMGFVTGYFVSYSTGSSVIRQYMSIYPLENISKALEGAREDRREGMLNETLEIGGIEFTVRTDELTDPRIGEESSAFRTIYTDEYGYYYIEYEIIFYKLNVYETLDLRGEVLDYELLKEMARKAADKIV